MPPPQREPGEGPFCVSAARFRRRVLICPVCPLLLFPLSPVHPALPPCLSFIERSFISRPLCQVPSLPSAQREHGDAI